jgi:hypothetical protein
MEFDGRLPCGPPLSSTNIVRPSTPWSPRTVAETHGFSDQSCMAKTPLAATSTSWWTRPMVCHYLMSVRSVGNCVIFSAYRLMSSHRAHSPTASAIRSSRLPNRCNGAAAPILTFGGVPAACRRGVRADTDLHGWYVRGEFLAIADHPGRRYPESGNNWRGLPQRSAPSPGICRKSSWRALAIALRNAECAHTWLLRCRPRLNLGNNRKRPSGFRHTIFKHCCSRFADRRL